MKNKKELLMIRHRYKRQLIEKILFILFFISGHAIADFNLFLVVGLLNKG